MENTLASLSIKDPGLKSLPPEVEKYFARLGNLSFIEVLPA